VACKDEPGKRLKGENGKGETPHAQQTGQASMEKEGKTPSKSLTSSRGGEKKSNEKSGGSLRRPRQQEK